MIDPTQLPLLLKAIDFVFEEGHKILEERREKRKSESNSLNDDVSVPSKEIVPQESVLQEKDIKQELLHSKIDELLWQSKEWEIESLVKRLESQTKSYHILKEQYEKWGSALVPPVIVIQIEEKENSMLETIKQLEIILSKVYKKDIKLI